MANHLNYLNQKILISLTAVLSMINGIAYLFFPTLSLSTLGINLGGAITLITRYYGACAIGFGLLLWLIRNGDPRIVQTAAVISILVVLGPSIFIGLSGKRNGMFNNIGWLIILTDTVLSTLSIYFLILHWINSRK